MVSAYYEVNLIPGIPDQEFTTSLNGLILNMRLYFSDTSKLWWLEISNSDRTVTVSQICMRPGVWHPLSGQMPGYSGKGAVGVARLRPNNSFSSVDAFNGSFGLYLYDEVESD
ncbi:phage baseplate plug family protein [Enterobacter chengduensis]|uniref:phage baseplate plug family protein n=1 Tax=Enterobacter chengduensis TaxID=2494701 RepID=UPI0005EDA2AD|nr:hypothetical protein [Enterobacter chengduensis]KJL97804.1 hypothetical protein SS39_19435 [Enterobacter chengduensis]KJM07594.1 hypothetical protein SS50_02240 [Enterobacter chengduensis]